jgi:hypothetical protein
MDPQILNSRERLMRFWATKVEAMGGVKESVESHHARGPPVNQTSHGAAVHGAPRALPSRRHRRRGITMRVLLLEDSLALAGAVSDYLEVRGSMSTFSTWLFLASTGWRSVSACAHRCATRRP